MTTTMAAKGGDQSDDGGKERRFGQDVYRPYSGRFKAHARARFLSPGIMYTVNLVFKFLRHQNSTHMFFVLKYQLGEETESSISYLTFARENGWREVELYQFTSDSTCFDLDIQFQCQGNDHNLAYFETIIEGIEFRPVEKVS
ncbi:hypothetical protein L6452_32185 [Arctium lappa]|uniref:Uncharacterized protein n=1 Tax=Arctium lappa TaxID=4217 RepID=A0ACB8Z4H7_ARCLA|nr:hypothetical protein L6452_32185 [Arctium lappa]